MIPSTLKGKLFVVLAFTNLGLASYFAAFQMIDQSLLSGITSFLCLAVWVSECSEDDEV